MSGRWGDQGLAPAGAGFSAHARKSEGYSSTAYCSTVCACGTLQQWHTRAQTTACHCW